jgi:hypothetical protein
LRERLDPQLVADLGHPLHLPDVFLGTPADGGVGDGPPKGRHAPMHADPDVQGREGFIVLQGLAGKHRELAVLGRLG